MTAQIVRLPDVDFPVHALVPNPTDKLVAVVGEHSIAVFSLPSKSWTTQRKRSIDVKCVHSLDNVAETPDRSPSAHSRCRSMGRVSPRLNGIRWGRTARRW